MKLSFLFELLNNKWETQAKFSFLSFDFFIHFNNSVNALKMNILDSQRNKPFVHTKNKIVFS
jgi:hypothetical protein